jgi:hypothetical protein
MTGGTAAKEPCKACNRAHARWHTLMARYGAAGAITTTLLTIGLLDIAVRPCHSCSASCQAA